MIKCPKCDTLNADDSMFCENCGTSLGAVAPVEAAAPVAAPAAPVEASAEPEKKGNKGSKIAIIIVAIVLVLALAGGAIWFFVLRDDSSSDNDAGNSASDEDDEDESEDADEDKDDNINTEDEMTTNDDASSDEEYESDEDEVVVENEELSFGLGIVSAYGSPRDADGDANGSLNVVTTAVAVLLDSEGRIVDIDLDTLDFKAAWSSDGVAMGWMEPKTKYELGTDYGMSLYAGTKEWYEQVDAFIATAKGKTVDEVKAFMTDDTYTTGDLAAAGCTISVGDFIRALEKAALNAEESTAVSENYLNLAFATTVNCSDAMEEYDGYFDITATIVAVVADSEGTVVVSATDAAQAKVVFDVYGVSITDITAELKTKSELGDSYMMSVYGLKHDGSDGQPLEWYEQADAFDATLIGKTVSEFSAFADEAGYSVGDLATAGCTIKVSDMIKAATKAVNGY